MIYVNPNVDIFILSNNKIQLRMLDFTKSSVEILEISGEDAADLALILPVIWDDGTTKQQFIDFFDGKYSEGQVDETIATLEMAGVISGEKVAGGCSFPSFCLNEISNNLSFFRIDCSVFILQTEKKGEAEALFDKISRRWGSEYDLAIFKDLLNGRLNVFPAKQICEALSGDVIENLSVCNKGISVINAKLVFAHGKLSLREYEPFDSAKKAITNPESYWGKFLTKAIHETGLVASTREMELKSEPFPLSKKFFLASHVLTDLSGKAVNDSQLGLGDTSEEACGKAVMESLERYCCQKKPEKMIKARALTLVDCNIINPNLLAYYLEEQFKQVKDLKNFQEDEEEFWTEIFDKNDKPWMIPASHIWYCFHRSEFVNEKSLFWASTNGTAAHISFEQAVFSAIRELIERDAIMVWWLNRLSPPVIMHSLLNNEHKKIINKLENCGFEVRMLNLTLDLLPVVMAVARNKNHNKPYFFCGASCHENFSTVCEKALLELEQTVWSRSNQEVVDIDAKCVDSPMDHETFYFDPKNGSKIDFLFNGCEQDVFNASMQFKSSRDLIAYLESKGFKIFLKDITCNEIRDAGLDMHVVKAVIPGLIPITFGFMTETLGLKRIYSLPVKLGLRKKPLTEEDVLENYQPHFFP